MINLQELSKIFGLTVDFFLDKNYELPLLVMRKEIDKNKYGNKKNVYNKILKEYYPEPWEVYVLLRRKKMSKLESIFDFFIGAGTVELADGLNDLSCYYLIKKGNLKLLVNIKNWVLEVKELGDINEKKFVVGKDIFKKTYKLQL